MATTEVSFHFTKQNPGNQLYNDIKALNKFPEDSFKAFMKLQLDFLVGASNHEQFISELTTFAQEQGASLNPVKNITKTLLTLFKVAAKRNLTPQYVQEDMENLGLSKDLSPIIGELWKTYLVGLSRTVMAHTFMVNPLVDMEWKFGVTAANSDMKVVGNSFLQLKLVVDRGGKKEDVYMELTLPQFYSFLHEMEKARTALEYLS